MQVRAKRFWAMLLAVVMVIGMLPVSAFASAGVPFGVSVGEVRPAEDLVWVDWMENEIYVPCYTVTLPEGTVSVTLTFDEEKQCCYYDASGNWIGYIGGDDTMAAAAAHTVAVGDANGDGELDGISVQTPNSFAAEYYVRFVYGSAGEQGGETPDPEAPFTEIQANGSPMAAEHIVYRGLVSFTSRGGTEYTDIPYYEIRVPQGTEKVYVTYPRSDFRGDSGLDAVTSATISGYSATVTAEGSGYVLSNPGGPALQATGDNATYTTVEIPVGAYILTDGTGSAVTPQTATTFEPVVFFSFSYTDETVTNACLKVLPDAPAVGKTAAGGLFKLNLSTVFADSEDHQVTYSFETAVENEHTKITDGVFYFTAEEEGSYEVTLTASCGAAEVSHKLTMQVEPPSEGIEAQYHYDESPKSSVTVYVTISNDGVPIVGADGTVMSHLEVTVPYFDLGLYGLEDFYRYGTDGGKGVYTSETVVQRPTGLHLYIYLLERYYMGLDENQCCMGAASGVLNYDELTEVYFMDGEKAYDSGGKMALKTTGGACSIYMSNFWGHDENLMYYRNHCFPLMNPGWGSTSDYILLSDGDAWEVAMFSNWSFYHTGCFASFDQDVYNAEPGASVTAATQKWGTTFEAVCFEAVNGSEGMTVGLYDSEWTLIGELEYDTASGNAITFTAPETPGTYYLLAMDTNAKDPETAKIAPATARVVVEAAPGSQPAEIPEGAPFVDVNTDAGCAITIEQKENITYTGYSAYEDIPHYHVTIPEGAAVVDVTYPASVAPFAEFSSWSGAYEAYGYYAETAGWTGGGITMGYTYDEAKDLYTISFPLSYEAYDYATGETVSMSFVGGGYAIAVENRDYAPIAFFTFEFGTPVSGGGEEVSVSRILLNTYEAALVYNKADSNALRLTATVLPAEATGWTILWTSSDETVATVDETGLVTGLKEGTAVITAAIGDIKAECTVTVEKFNSAPAAVSGALVHTKVKTGEALTLDLSALFADAEGDTMTLTAAVQKAVGLTSTWDYQYAAVEGFDTTVTDGVFTVTFPETGIYAIAVSASDGKLSGSHIVQVTVVNNDAGVIRLNDGVVLDMYNVVVVYAGTEFVEDYEIPYKGTHDTTIHHIVLSKDTLSGTPHRKMDVVTADGYSWGQYSGVGGGSTFSTRGNIGLFATDAQGVQTAHFLIFHTECAVHTDEDKNQVCDVCWMDTSCETCADENGDKVCDVCGKVLNKLPHLIEGVEAERTVVIQTGHAYSLSDLSGGRIFTDGDDTLTYSNYKVRKSSDGGVTWSDWTPAFTELDFGGITDSLVNSVAGIYIYQFKAFDSFGDSEDTWTLTLDTRDVVPANVSFYLGRDHQYSTTEGAEHTQLPVLELYVTAGIDENLYDYIGWFEKDGQTVYVYNPRDYEIIDGETDYVVIDGVNYELFGYEKVTFTNSAFDDSDETAAASGTVVDGYNMFYAAVLTGRYSTRVYGYNGETDAYDVYLGGQSMELPREKDIYGNGGNDIYLRQVSIYTTSKKLDGSYFTAEDYYAEMIMPVTGSMVHAGDPYVKGNYTYYPFFSWSAGNGSLYNCYVYPRDTDAYIFTQSINNTTTAGTSVVTKSMAISTAVELKVTVPENGDFGLYLQYNNFNTQEIEPYGEVQDNEDGTKTVTYKVSKGNANYTYRLTDPSGTYVTKAGWIKCTADTEKTVAFSQFTDKASHDFSQLGTQVATRDEADIQVFLSATGFKSVSETTRIRAYRMWQIIDTDAQNIMIEPDFNIQVLQGNKSDITLVSGGNVLNNWIDVNPTTTDIVAVNYNALEVLTTSDEYGSHGGFYPATSPERTNVFVITNEPAGTAVAHIPFNGSKETDRGAEWDYNYDTWFYLGSDEAPKLDFTVSGTGNVAVSYATVITGDDLKSTLSGWTTVTADENGTYYVDLLSFRSAGAKGGTVIIKMTDATGTSYSLVRVAEFNAQVENVSNPGEPIMPGDEVSVTFDGLYRSINKISGVFNPTKYQLRYTSAGTEISGGLAQYQQMDRTTITLSIPEDLEFPEGQDTVDFSFTNGYVFGTMYSAASPFDTMYLMTDTGMGTNFSAVGTEYVLSRMADIPVTVHRKVTYDVKIVISDGGQVLEDYTFVLRGPNGTELTADENGIYQDLGYGDYDYTVSKKGYIVRNATVHLGAANEAQVVDGLLTLTFVMEKAAEGAWDGESVTEPVLVDGIYQISTGAELAWFAQTVNGGALDINAVLTRDIDLAGYNWTPIGSSKAKFSGTFDGKGRKVINLVIINNAYAAGTGAGLFGYGDGCTIENLTVEGAVSLTSSASVATAYAGGVLGGGSAVTLNNVHAAVDITISRVKGNWARVGGVFGGGDGNITNCSYSGTLKGYQYCGGIAGYITAGTVSNCRSEGTVHAVNTYAGGIAGSNAGGDIVGCYNVGAVTAAGNYAGGIAAAHSSGKLTNCFNAGAVSANTYAGAIAGNVTKDTATVIHNYYLESTCGQAFGGFKGMPSAEAVTAKTLASSRFVASVNAELETPAYKRGEQHPILVWEPDYVAPAPVVTLTADRTEIEAGQTVTLTLTLDRTIEDAYIWQWNIIWNSGLFEAVSMEKGGAYSGSAVNMNGTTLLPAPYGASSVTSGNTLEIHDLEAGVLCTLTLRAKEDITADEIARFYADFVLLENGVTDEENNIIGVPCEKITTHYEWGDDYTAIPPEETQYLAVSVEAAEISLEFTDVAEGAYYYDAVVWAVKNGITTGTSDDTFDPEAVCDREMIVTFLWRAAGCPEPTSTENPFTDVTESSYAYKAVLWAVENGITNGISATEFGLHMPCAREMVVTLLWRAAGKPEPVTTENPFTDVAEDAYYYKAVLWAVENGITTGYGNGLFGPTDTCTRGMIVTFLYRSQD